MRSDYERIIQTMIIDGRTKKPKTVIEEIKEKAKKIADEYIDFTHGFRCVQLILRSADGGGTNNRKELKYETQNTEEFIEALEDCLAFKYIMGLNYRIYSSVNERDFRKAERTFKQNMLDNDYADDTVHKKFYTDLRNGFISALMKPSNSKTSYFLIDIDQNDLSPYIEWFEERDLVITYYKTKNGWHIITKPFNPAEFTQTETAHIQKDSLLLLHY